MLKFIYRYYNGDGLRRVPLSYWVMHINIGDLDGYWWLSSNRWPSVGVSLVGSHRFEARLVLGPAFSANETEQEEGANERTTD